MTQASTRKPLIALLASAVLPGLGQLYNGELIKGLLLFLTFTVFYPTGPVTAWLALHAPKHHTLLVVVLILALIVVMYVYSLVNAFRTAKRISNNYSPKPFNQSYVYIIVLIIGFSVIFGFSHYTHKYLMASFSIPSQGMLPTLLPGDVVFADKRVNCADCKNRLRHGDIAIFVDPDDHSKRYVKRIIGLPDDDITIKGTDIRVNDVPIRTEQVTEFGHDELTRLLATHVAWREKSGLAVYKVIWQKDMKPENKSFTVPKDKIFVLGDNRNAAQDARNISLVPVANVIGIAKQVRCSRSKDKGIRWWRFGFVVNPYY